MGSYGQMVAGAFVKDLLKSTIVKKVPKLVNKSSSEDLPLAEVWNLIDKILRNLVSKVASAPFQLRVLCYYIKVGESQKKRIFFFFTCFWFRRKW